MKILHFFKVVAINLVTFIILLFIINWACGYYLKRTAGSGREQLPNYAHDKIYAKEIFRDYNSVQHQYEPFVEWKVLPYTGKTLHIDEEGNRIHKAPLISEVKSSVVFFGGSTMWGEGSDDQHTIPALFNKKNPEYAVSNRGQLAYNSRQELDALITLYSKNIKPDIVVFYDGVNDAAFLCPSEIKELPSHRLVNIFRSKLYISKFSFIKEVLWTSFLENIVKLLNKNIGKIGTDESLYNCLGENGKAEEIAEILIKNWEIANQLVTSRGGKFYAILQPAAFIAQPKVDHLTLDPVLRKNFSEVYKHIKQKISERQYNWVYDLSNSFDKDEYIYIDFCHVSPNGNEIMADKITRVITGP